MKQGDGQLLSSLRYTSGGSPIAAEQSAGPRLTNFDTVVITNLPTASYTLQASPQGNAGFYRVQSP